MGNCDSRAVSEEDQTNAKIEDEIRKDGKAQQSLIKILLLGAGQSGKTTFMKQIQYLYSNGFDSQKLALYKRIIMTNFLDYADSFISEIVKADEMPSEFMSLVPVVRNAERGSDELDHRLAESFHEFWKNKDVQHYFKKSDHWLQNDSAKYYFDRVQTLCKRSYTPSCDDIVRCRVKTTGIYELRFQYTDGLKRKHNYLLTDVGGQRSERNKWIHCFENVMAIIFFVDLSGFNMTLDEAPTQNRLEESIALFDAISNSQWFRNTFIILFFNKTDLFKEKLEVIKFADYVPGYQGDNDFDSTITYLKKKFQGLSRLTPNKPIYVHLTCATDTKNMKFVFHTVSDVIIRNSLKASGLM